MILLFLKNTAIALITSLIIILVVRYGPKRLANVVSPNDIEYVVIESDDYERILDSEKDIKVFTKALKRAYYFEVYRNYKYGFSISIVIHYKDGSKIGFGSHRIKIGDNNIKVYRTNFDYETIYEMVELNPEMWLG